MLLSEIGMVPPPIGTPWGQRATAQAAPQPGDTGSVTGNVFWYDPPWHDVDPAVALEIVKAMDTRGIVTAALGSELGVASIADQLLIRTMTPYRPDRYGLNIDDLRSANVVDMRLARVRDTDGRYAYSREQLVRWLGMNPGDQDAGNEARNATIVAPGWPADVPELEHLGRKWKQFRSLQPSVRCAVSVPPYRLANELPRIIATAPDIVILRMDDSDEFDAVAMVQAVLLVKKLIDKVHPATKLWLVPINSPAPDDCVKLYALGVDSVAIDWWCQPLLSAPPRTAMGLGDLASHANPYLQAVDELLAGPLARVAGLIDSCAARRPHELNRRHLHATNRIMAKLLEG